MEVYQSEEQQVEAIKKYWHENGNSLIAGLVIGLGGFIGWNYYQDSQIEAQEALSMQYQEAMESFAASDSNFKANTEAFINENSDSAYSAFAAFALAKDAVDQQDWATAEKHLSKAVELATDENIKAIAYIRLAKIQVQQQAYEKALTTLSNPLPETFTVSAEVTKGDIYLLQENPELARAAYQAAADAGGLQSNPSLQMKLDDLAVALTVAN